MSSQKSENTVEYSFRVKDRQGRVVLACTFYGQENELVETITYWPNGRVQQVSTIKTDELLAFLRNERASRDVTSSPA